MYGAAIPAIRAIAWTQSEPPSRRTYAPKSATSKPLRSPGSSRRAQGVTPRSPVSTRARSGTIGVKPKVAIGRKVKGKDGCGSPSIKEHGGKTRLGPAEGGVHARDEGSTQVRGLFTNGANQHHTRMGKAPRLRDDASPGR